MNVNMPPLDRHRLMRAILFISGILLLAGCSRTPVRVEPTFDFALPASWSISSVQRVDTTGDGEQEEWVILYTFDQPENQAFTPVRCAVYHITRREPKLPIIYPYHLQAPGWTYLGEGTGRTSVRIEDVVTRITLDPQKVYTSTTEVIVESKDAEGFITRASIFQWRDNVQNPLLDPNEALQTPNQEPGKGQWYQCLGLFEATIQVQVDRDRVTVRNRIPEQRSQFALVNVYQPTGRPGGYLDEAFNLTAPSSSCIDFAFGVPGDVAQSPYPEKIVMAFHHQLTVGPGYGQDLLTDGPQDPHGRDHWGLMSPTNRPQIKGFCMLQIRYNPEGETEAEISAFETQATAQGTKQAAPDITAYVETLASYNMEGKAPEQYSITWKLIKKDNMWKIDDMKVQKVG